MRRILILGSGGSGKTTLALQVSEATGHPVVHLDSLYWKAGWVATPEDEWRERVAALVERPAWVMDGNYGGTLDLRIAAADTIVFLDLSRVRCLWRVLKRRLAFAGRSRSSLPEGCSERVTLEFLVWIWSYPRRRRPGVLARLAAVADTKQVVVLRTPAEATTWLRGLAAAGA